MRLLPRRPFVVRADQLCRVLRLFVTMVAVVSFFYIYMIADSNRPINGHIHKDVQSHSSLIATLAEHLRKTVSTSYQRNDSSYGQFVDELVDEYDIDNDRIMRQLKFTVPKTSKIFTIFVESYLGIGVLYGNHEFINKKCLVSNCETVRQASTADAVVFRHTIGRKRTFAVPSSQLWIYSSLESPSNTPSLIKGSHGINYTATYRWDSDIVTPYERWTRIEEIEDHLVRRQNWLLAQNKVMRNHNDGKTKEVAWFTSHCKTESGRERYVQELSKHLTVDIYGTCGKLKCHRNNKECQQMLSDDYHFYLAFENSLCSDYITEKYFRTGLGNNIIPIVMGASLEEYTRASPPNSFIHVDQFDSVASLSSYLRYLMVNSTAYNEYFAWKGRYTLIDTKFWCRLCSLIQSGRRKTYTDLDMWWKVGAKKCGKNQIYW